MARWHWYAVLITRVISRLMHPTWLLCLADAARSLGGQDRGIPVMQSSLLLWTLVTGVTSLIRNLPQQQRFPALLAARAALGLAQACIMPATSAMAAK